MRVVEERLVAVAPRERLQKKTGVQREFHMSVSGVGVGTVPLRVMGSSPPHLGTDVHVRRLVGRVRVVVRLVLGGLDVSVHGGDEHDRDREEEGDVLPEVARTCVSVHKRDGKRERDQ